MSSMGGGIFPDCKISVRGNGTAYYEKKPYKLKLSESSNILDGSSNKDWVLLADFNDRSMLRTAYMFELSKTLGFEYTPYYEYVDLFINDDYKGLYILTDKVEKSRNRVNINKDGFLIEDDNHWKNENLWFMTSSLNSHYTFKYPNASDNEIIEGDENFEYIRRFVEEFEQSLLVLENDNYDLQYTNYIDVPSFAKWYILADVTANADSNLFYVLNTRGDKLKKMPIWDLEWSMGLLPAQVRPSGVFNYDEELHKKSKYFFYLFNSPLFIEMIRKEWEKLKTKIPHFKLKMDSISKRIEKAQLDNIRRWPDPSFKLSFYYNNSLEETDYLRTFFDKRLLWFNEYIYRIDK